ncbi:ROK family protein [Blastococcus brunescens]|uniref:ROK family protein n=1 Tax=Blastococcus brunescens TaxID=1564165 RepID=A0ABZ1B8G4_9ACTN|nr:ROK family protein [Blastococcus sp. BMG 8361]WRL67085.1 ROK family protein [Blastococcus sp. BMG 8361]
MPRVRRQRRERHGAGRDGHRRFGPGRPRRQGRDRHRLRGDRRRAGVPGAQGSAGDIGHIYVQPADGRTVLCRCGNENCLEAIAGGGALLRDATAAGLPVSSTRDVVELAAQGDGPALELVRDAGRTIGTVLAALVNFFNPHRIVMTGGVAQAGAPLLAGIREAVYRRSMPLAARALEITVSDAPDLSGRVGAALMAIEEYLDEDSVVDALAR